MIKIKEVSHLTLFTAENVLSQPPIREANQKRHSGHLAVSIGLENWVIIVRVDGETGVDFGGFHVNPLKKGNFIVMDLEADFTELSLSRMNQKVVNLEV